MKILFLVILSSALSGMAGEFLLNPDFRQWEDGPKNLKNWKAASMFPVNWNPVDRPDRQDSSIKKADGKGIFLNGTIQSDLFSVQGKVRFRLTVNAESPSGSLRIFLLEKFPWVKDHFTVAAYLLELREKAISGEYVTEFDAYNQPVEDFALVLDGSNVTVRKVSLQVVPSQKNEAAASLTIPVTRKVPDIDGRFSKEEWEHSLQIRNPFLSLADGKQVEKGEVLYLTSDSENLYVALVCPAGETRTNAASRDSDVFADDSLELYAVPQYGRDAPEAFQIICNFSGTVLDILHKVHIGQSEKAWSCPGLLSAGKMDGTWAVMELKIPFRSLGISDPSVPFGLNLCRNYPGESLASSLDGKEYFNRKGMTSCRVSSGMPPVEFSSFPRDKKFNFRAQSSDGLFLKVQEDGGKLFSCGKELKAGHPEEFATDERNSDGVFQVSILSGGQNELLRLPRKYSLSQGRNAKTASRITLEHYPFRKTLVARLKEIGFSEQKKFGRAEFVIESPDGKKETLSVPQCLFFGNAGGYELAYSPKTNGVYAVSCTVFYKDGTAFDRNRRDFLVKDYSWLGNAYGKDRIVIPPFIPLKREGNAIECLMRTYQFDATGFPKQITADGEAILSDSIRLQLEKADGTTVSAKGENLRFTSVSEDRIEFESEMKLPGMSVKLSGWMEYDGLVYYTMKLLPENQVRVKRLSLLIPVRDCDFFHFVPDRIRSYNKNFWDLRELKGEGIVWKSTSVKNVANCYGNFLSSFWLGNMDRGITFCAESDKGWINTSRSPCFEVVKDARNVSLKVNFIAVSSELEKPRTISFGLIANPVKPRPTGINVITNDAWRTSFDKSCFNTGLYVNDFYIASCLDSKNNKTALLPYTCANEYVEGEPEFRNSGEEFHRIYAGLSGSSPEQMNACIGGLPETENFRDRCVVWTPERVDFMLWRIHDMMEKLTVDGIYLDNSFATFSDNLFGTKQSFLREDGRLQGTFNLLLQREYLKRVAVLAHTMNKKRWPRIVVHNTNAQMLGAGFAFADVTYGGEMDIPEKGDHYDVFYPPWPQIMWGADWGGAPGALTMLGYGDRAQQERPNRAMFSLFKLYDMGIWNSGMKQSIHNTFLDIEKEFGTSAADSRFVGFWKNGKVRLETPDGPVKASYFERPGKMLIYFSNSGGQAEKVSFSLPGSGILKNAETGKIITQESGKYKFMLNCHDLAVFTYKTGDTK